MSYYLCIIIGFIDIYVPGVEETVARHIPVIAAGHNLETIHIVKIKMEIMKGIITHRPDEKFLFYSFFLFLFFPDFMIVGGRSQDVRTPKKYI